MRAHIKLVESMHEYQPSPALQKAEAAMEKIQQMAMQQATREVDACIQQIKALYPDHSVSWRSGMGSTSIEFSPPLQFEDYEIDTLITGVEHNDYQRVGDDPNGQKMLGLATMAFQINEYVTDVFKVEVEQVDH